MNFDKINQKLEETMCFSANEDKIGKVSAELLQYLGQKKIIIYPAGALGQLLEKTLASYNISIFSFIDRESPNLVKIGETPVYAPNYLEKLDEIGNSIFSILRPHIDKENSILFMIADMHLDDKQKKTILDKFKKFDSKK